MKYMFPVTGEPVKLKRGQQDELVKKSVNSWQAYTDQWHDWLIKAREASNLYCDNRPGGPARKVKKPEDAPRSRVRLPVVAQAVDAVTSQQHLANFPQDETFFKLRPQNKPAQEMQAALEQHLEDSFEYLNFMALAQKDRKALALAGGAVVWHPWVVCKEKRYTYRRPSLLGLEIGKPKREEDEVVVFEGTAFVPLHIEDVRFDATVDNIQETNVAFRRWMDIEELKGIDKLQNKDDIASFHDYHDDSGSRKRDYYTDWGIDPLIGETDSATAKEKCLLYEEWGDFYCDGKFYENYVLIYSNERVFHYFGPNDFDHRMKPFTICPYVYMPNSLLGKSLAHDIIPMAHGADTLTNQALDIFSITSNPAYTYLYNDEGLRQFFANGVVELTPGLGIPVMSHDSIRPIEHDRRVVSEIMSLHQIIKEEIRESTGGVPYATGGMNEAEGERTLGEVEILASGTSTRFQMIIQTYDEMRLKPYIKMSVSNLRQFMTKAIFPIDKNPITPDAIKEAEFDVNVTGSKSVMSRKKDFDDMMFVMERLLPGLIQNGFAQPNGSMLQVNVPGMAEEVFKMTAIKNLPDLYEVITPDQQEIELEEEGITDGFAAISGIGPGGAAGGMGQFTGPAGLEIAPAANY